MRVSNKSVIEPHGLGGFVLQLSAQEQFHFRLINQCDTRIQDLHFYTEWEVPVLFEIEFSLWIAHSTNKYGKWIKVSLDQMLSELGRLNQQFASQVLPLEQTVVHDACLPSLCPS